MSERKERVTFILTLNKKQCERYKHDISCFAKIPSLETGDEFVITYTIDLDYYGTNLVRNLKILEKLSKDNSVMVKANIKEVIQGQCVLRDLLKELEKWTR